jgi:hypothetical protein
MHAANFLASHADSGGDSHNLGESFLLIRLFGVWSVSLTSCIRINKVFGDPIVGVVRSLVYLGPVLVKI